MVEEDPIMQTTKPTWLLPILFAALILLLSQRSGAGVTVGLLTDEKEAYPGETYQGTISLTNNDSLPQEVIIYQTDYLFFSDGSNQFGEAGKLERSNAAWITFSPNQLEVPPHQGSRVSYEVKVPNDSTLVGTYWSMLMVEEVGLSLDSLSNMQVGIRQVVRYGFQCVTHIGSTGHHQLSFTGTRLIAEESAKKELEVDVANIGERWAVPSAWVELYDSDGHHVGRFESERKRIFPGTSVRFQMDLGDTPSGKYKALIVLDNGDQNVFGAKYDLEF